MCVVGVACEAHPRWPVIIAANRDEFLLRRSSGPEVLGVDDAGRPFVGGRDLERGGTWMGVGAGGFFVGLTNQRVAGPVEQAPRSRGEVVLRGLSLGGADALTRWLDELEASDYLPFNLMYGSAAEGMRVAYVRPGAAVQIAEVPPGIHALPNDVLDSPRFPRAARVRRRMREVLSVERHGRGWPELSAELVAVLSDTTEPTAEEIAILAAQVDEIPEGLELLKALDVIRIQTPVYGTRSSTLVALAPEAVAGYSFVEGPPGEAPLIDHTSLLNRS